MTRRVTMRDVARAVDMSPMTVSRALRGDQTVNPDTREKVQAAATQLGYVYDTTAQAFRTQKSGFVAVILPSINNANFAETYRGLTDALVESGLQILLGSTGYSVEKEEALVRQLLARNPQAIVLTGGHHTDETRALLAGARVPVVEVWDLPSDPLGHVVGFSNADAMTDLVRHLADGGRRHLAFLGAEPETDRRGAARLDGLLAAAADLNLPPPKVIAAGPAPISMRHGASVVTDMGRDVTDFNALVCVSDPVAFGAMTACQRLGIKVPEQIAITGFGHFEVAAVSNPRITTVGVYASQIGSRTAAVLQDIFAGQTSPQFIDVGSELILGETS